MRRLKLLMRFLYLKHKDAFNKDEFIVRRKGEDALGVLAEKYGSYIISGPHKYRKPCSLDQRGSM